jgi:hypothetical protein
VNRQWQNIIEKDKTNDSNWNSVTLVWGLIKSCMVVIVCNNVYRSWITHLRSWTARHMALVWSQSLGLAKKCPWWFDEVRASSVLEFQVDSLWGVTGARVTSYTTSMWFGKWTKRCNDCWVTWVSMKVGKWAVMLDAVSLKCQVSMESKKFDESDIRMDLLIDC